MTSLVTKHVLFGRNIFIKRDDLLICNGISGNKVRKLEYLIQYIGQLNDVNSNPIVIGSYGGYQSNAMFAISSVTSAFKHCKFIYFTKNIPSSLASSPSGNLKSALMQHGMIMNVLPSTEYNLLPKLPKSIEAFPQELCNKNISASIDFSHAKLVWIPQGVACQEAELGVTSLMKEILKFINETEKFEVGSKPWKLMFASGTGTMALFAARYIALHKASIKAKIEVVAVPCVGIAADLMTDMKQLDSLTGVFGMFPTVLDTTHCQSHSQTQNQSKTIKEPKYKFGKPSKHLYGIWKQIVADSGIKFDLVYAPRAFDVLRANRYFNNDDNSRDCNLIYYHCGGLEGNESQLQRYRDAKIINE